MEQKYLYYYRPHDHIRVFVSLLNYHEIWLYPDNTVLFRLVANHEIKPHWQREIVAVEVVMKWIAPMQEKVKS